MALKIRLHNTKQISIVVQALSVTLGRSEVTSFPQTIIQLYYQLFIKNPTGSFNYMAYIEPLRPLAWVFVLLFCVLTPPFLYLTIE